VLAPDCKDSVFFLLEALYCTSELPIYSIHVVYGATEGQTIFYTVSANCAYDNSILDVCSTVHWVNRCYVLLYTGRTLVLC
jgi:hypothetical protein